MSDRTEAFEKYAEEFKAFMDATAPDQPGIPPSYAELVAERDALREENERLKEVAQAWLELHSFPHTPLDVFNLADRTRAALEPSLPERNE